MTSKTANWHVRSVEAVISELRTTLSGLTTETVGERRVAGGRNIVSPPPRRSPLRLLGSQFQSPLILILLAAAIISFAFRAMADGWIILGVVIFNGLVGYIQERKAGEAMDRLKSLTPQLVRVFRHGEELEVPAEDLVVGDMVVLEAGSIVPADGRLVESVNLKVNEAVFTGESVPARKQTEPLPELTPLTERNNLAWRGTTVAAGRGRLVVTDIGMATRFGAIVREVSQIAEPKTPFQERMADFAKRLSVAVVALAAGVFGLSIIRAISLEQSLLLAVSLIVSMIPEGLPVVITLTFAWGMWRMAQRHALIRKLYAVETLGSVTMIVSDKTGTLTFGEMMVEEIVTDHREIHVTGEGYRRVGDFFEGGERTTLVDDTVLRKLVEVGVLNNDSRISRDERGLERWVGDPTEIALAVLGEKAGFQHKDVDVAFPRVGEFPFDFTLKYMVTFHRSPSGQYLIAVKGAPRTVLDLCTLKLTPNGVQEFTAEDRADTRQQFEQMAEHSLRGLCLAFAETAQDWRSITHENLGEHLVYLGLVGIRDPLRPEAKDTIRHAQQAGIRVVMLTGDYRVTALSVAREAGIIGLDEGDHRVLDGSAVEHMSDRELQQRLQGMAVFSRVSPEQKLRIARLLKRNGEIIAMTGDGINDVPALTEANIGVAIGMSSADAAKEAAEMVVTDGNLSSIVAAVEEGRVIFRNIQRVLLFLLASNLSDLLVVLSAMFIGLPLPLLPIHIIWLNVITDPFLGIALAREPKSPNVMRERPRPPQAQILNRGHWARIAQAGVTVTLSTLFVFLYALATDRSSGEVYGLTLTTIAIGQWLVGFTSRSARRSSFSSLGKSPLMLAAVGVNLALQASILYVPFLARAFHVAPLGWADWVLMLAAASLTVAVEETRKALFRQRTNQTAV